VGDVVNLRRARKRKAREQEAELAAERRALFSEPASARELRRRNDALVDARLDGARLSDGRSPGDDKA
jgi:hypothetical protein